MIMASSTIHRDLRTGRPLWSDRRRPPARCFRFRHWIAATLIALPLAACDALPKDPDGTLHAIQTRGDIRVAATAPLPPEALRLLDRLQTRTSAIPRLQTGELEPLLARLDKGDVDLVVAPFRKGTLLETSAALSPPLATSGQGEQAIEWRAAMKNGENRWISIVEASARDAGDPQ